jgi:hypothetical protein
MKTRVFLLYQQVQYYVSQLISMNYYLWKQINKYIEEMYYRTLYPCALHRILIILFVAVREGLAARSTLE